jgi:hypothetical protein
MTPNALESINQHRGKTVNREMQAIIIHLRPSE